MLQVPFTQLESSIPSSKICEQQAFTFHRQYGTTAAACLEVVEPGETLRVLHSNSSSAPAIPSPQHKQHARFKKHRQCKHQDCVKQPCYNVEGASHGLYCAAHKEDGMCDVKAKRCEHNICRLWPAFNVEGKPQVATA